KFFNPNLCHICKATVAYYFIACDHCHMVIYCSQEHKQLHQLQHMQICIAVRELLNMDAGWETGRLSKEEWIQSRQELMRLIKEKLSRNLELQEMAMIIYAKSCRICHQQMNLLICTTCYSANYCIEHAELFQIVHSSNCYNQWLFLVLEVAFINNFSVLLKFNLLFDVYEPLINMHAFIQKHLKTGPYRYLSVTFFPYDYLYSDFASAPLTLYHGLRDTELFDSLEVEGSYYVIHIIGIKYCSGVRTPPWELFLHLLNHIRHLTIVMTELNFNTECFYIDTCNHCKERNRTISIEFYSMSYYSYVQSNVYKRPNVIIGFQIDFNDRFTWSETILELPKQNCPLFLT
ncbi:hypothetical protein EAI_11997, partial [Harpegnathos saltator]